MKPDLSLYVGNYVQGIVRGDEPWQWGIRLDDGTEIRNKDRGETFVPDDIVGARIKTIMFSEADTVIQFSNGARWSFNPTQYALHDPKHGGEVYPQWPEELEEAGIPSHPEEGVSDEPENPRDWEKHRQQKHRSHQARIEGQAQEFLKEDQDESGSS